MNHRMTGNRSSCCGNTFCGSLQRFVRSGCGFGCGFRCLISQKNAARKTQRGRRRSFLLLVEDEETGRSRIGDPRKSKSISDPRGPIIDADGLDKSKSTFASSDVEEYRRKQLQQRNSADGRSEILTEDNAVNSSALSTPLPDRRQSRTASFTDASSSVTDTDTSSSINEYAKHVSSISSNRPMTPVLFNLDETISIEIDSPISLFGFDTPTPKSSLDVFAIAKKGKKKIKRKKAIGITSKGVSGKAHKKQRKRSSSTKLAENNIFQKGRSTLAPAEMMVVSQSTINEKNLKEYRDDRDSLKKRRKSSKMLLPTSSGKLAESTKHIKEKSPKSQKSTQVPNAKMTQKSKEEVGLSLLPPSVLKKKSSFGTGKTPKPSNSTFAGTSKEEVDASSDHQLSTFFEMFLIEKLFTPLHQTKKKKRLRKVGDSMKNDWDSGVAPYIREKSSRQITRPSEAENPEKVPERKPEWDSVTASSPSQMENPILQKSKKNSLQQAKKTPETAKFEKVEGSQRELYAILGSLPPFAFLENSVLQSSSLLIYQQRRLAKATQSEKAPKGEKEGDGSFPPPNPLIFEDSKSANDSLIPSREAQTKTSKTAKSTKARKKKEEDFIPFSPPNPLLENPNTTEEPFKPLRESPAKTTKKKKVKKEARDSTMDSSIAPAPPFVEHSIAEKSSTSLQETTKPPKTAKSEKLRKKTRELDSRISSPPPLLDYSISRKSSSLEGQTSKPPRSTKVRESKMELNSSIASPPSSRESIPEKMAASLFVKQSIAEKSSTSLQETTKPPKTAKAAKSRKKKRELDSIISSPPPLLDYSISTKSSSVEGQTSKPPRSTKARESETELNSIIAPLSPFLEPILEESSILLHESEKGLKHQKSKKARARKRELEFSNMPPPPFQESTMAEKSSISSRPRSAKVRKSANTAEPSLIPKSGIATTTMDVADPSFLDSPDLFLERFASEISTPSFRDEFDDLVVTKNPEKPKR